MLCGIDEAGRGPVIGPLVVCLAKCSERHEKKLNSLCQKDSKQLTPDEREKILKELEKFCDFFVEIIPAERINKLMDEMSLNDIEARAMAELMKKARCPNVIIDMPDRYEWVFRRRMERFGIFKFEAEHKADENFPIVAAASICAKVVRDREVEKLHAIVGDFGSGYPSDEKTVEFLRSKENLKKASKYIRKKWKTLENVLQMKLAFE
ncbi:MAG: ribonuclease HII [Candidatus Anstonellales archaeon]